MTYAVLLSCSYFVFTTKTGITPLAPGQRAPFLAVYTGFFVLNNFLRPVRLAVAASLAPYMERVIVKIQTKVGKRQEEQQRHPIHYKLTTFHSSVPSSLRPSLLSSLAPPAQVQSSRCHRNGCVPL